MTDYSTIFGAISAMLSFISFIAAVWLFFRTYCFVQRMKTVDESNSLHQSLFLIRIIKWLSLCDIIYCFINADQFLSVASYATFKSINSDYPGYVCSIKGVIYQFFLCGGVSWIFIICLVLLRLVFFHTNLRRIGRDMEYYHVFVWTTSLISCIIPLIGDAFGYADNENGNHFQCWIKRTAYQWCAYGPIIPVFVFGAILLGYCVYLSCYKKERLSPLTMRIIYFTVAFFLFRIFPVISRIYGLLHNNIPIAIVYLHDMSKSSTGLSNAIVWGTTDLFAKHRRLGKMTDDTINDYDHDNTSDSDERSISTSTYGAFDVAIGDHSFREVPMNDENYDTCKRNASLRTT